LVLGIRFCYFKMRMNLASDLLNLGSSMGWL
jgi:hypothetical protein